MKWRAELMAEHESEDRFILTMMFALLIGYGCIANEIGSHLLGAFIAGMSFCWMQPALMLWHSQVKRIANWLIRLFFGATVAFSIPIAIMMDLDALWKVSAPLQENGLFFEFSLCLSRACLGKIIIFIHVCGSRRPCSYLLCAFDSLRPFHSRALTMIPATTI